MKTIPSPCITALGPVDLSQMSYATFCPHEQMVLTIGGRQYLFEREAKSALALLKVHRDLPRTLICFPSSLTQFVVFFQVNFPKFPPSPIWGKGYDRRDRFVRETLLRLVVEYNVERVIVGKSDLLSEIKAKDEPVFDDCLYEVLDINGQLRRVSSGELINPIVTVSKPRVANSSTAPPPASNTPNGGTLITESSPKSWLKRFMGHFRRNPGS